MKKYVAGGAMPMAMQNGKKVPAFVAGVKSPKPNVSNKGGAMRGLERAAAMSGRTMPTTGKPTTLKTGGKAKKYMLGGPVDGEVNITGGRAMPAASNMGGAMRGLDRASAMSGRAMPTMGRPTTGGPMPVAMKKGGSIDGCAVRGKTKTTMVKMSKGGKCK